MSDTKQIYTPVQYRSWIIENDTIAIKKCDKSFFLYNGSTIPQGIYWFFRADEMELGAKKTVTLQFCGKEYQAYLQREICKPGRIRIFWFKDLGKVFADHDKPEHYPSIRFVRIGVDSYAVLFEEVFVDDAKLPEEVDETDGRAIIEGAKKTITVNAYERDPKAKKKCKDYYLKRDGRIVCQICGFDFGKVYGREYADMIHVHHIIPVSEIGEEYVVDPIKDLIPVCPNCHFVLHTGVGISVEALIKRLKETST